MSRCIMMEMIITLITDTTLRLIESSDLGIGDRVCVTRQMGALRVFAWSRSCRAQLGRTFCQIHVRAVVQQRPSCCATDMYRGCGTKRRGWMLIYREQA